MREYYTKKGLVNTNPTHLLLQPNGIQWDLYEALVRGLPSNWRPNTSKEILAAIADKDIQRLFKELEWLDSQTIEYSVKTSLTTVRSDRRAVCFLKKYPFSKSETPFDPRRTALDKWQSAETLCAQTNARLKDENLILPTWFHRARRIIADTLGPLSCEALKDILTSGTHGPGATVTSIGNRTTPYYKYMDFPYSVTETAAPYALAAISHQPLWLELLESSGRRKRIPPSSAPRYQREMQIFHDCVEVVNSDKVTFVPKDAKTERPIAVGASLNVYLQLGVNSYIVKRLKRVGVDLTDQQKNRDFALSGSLYSQVDGLENPNQFSTIDLASASDTISHELVKKLLPSEWYALLDDLRHKEGIIEGNLVSYDKFSAMGNGYTFSLESLIFWAVAKAAIQDAGWTCTERDLAVYGDDIIVRYKTTPHVLEALAFCGFMLNQEKSFLSGPFKESCGADYFKGKNVRPFYLKKELLTYADIYFVANSVGKIVEHQQGCGYTQIYSECFKLIPKAQVRLIPISANSESGFQVPLSYVRHVGLTPYLSDSEKKHLFSRRLIKKEDLHLQSCYWVSLTVSPISYRGYAKARLMLALMGVQGLHTFTSLRDFIHIEAASSGQVTRRNAFTYSDRVIPCSNWDYGLTRRSFDHVVWSI